jgi:hypothetical protein
MTIRLHPGCAFMTRSRSVAYQLLFALLLAAVLPATHARADARVQAGFATAQSCENEVDDDLGSYEECINHAANTLRSKPHALLGLHFQAWLVADLAARQHGPRAAHVRRVQLRSVHRQSRVTGITLDQLCTLKNMRCAEVRVRMRHHIN